MKSSGFGAAVIGDDNEVKRHLFLGKNNVQVSPKDSAYPCAGYLSLHQVSNHSKMPDNLWRNTSLMRYPCFTT